MRAIPLLMRCITALLGLILVVCTVGCAPDSRCVVIAHRGASGYLAEHTLAAYALAYGMGADVIEPDVVLTGDGVPVCSHDVTLPEAASVVLSSRFADRRRPDGKWYLIDFTVEELRAVDQAVGDQGWRGPRVSPPTLDEAISMIRRLNEVTGQSVEIVPEAKAPQFHRENGRPIEGALIETLAKLGYTKREDGAIIQCFDLDSLERMRTELKSDLRLVYLVREPLDDETLDDIAKSVDGIGPSFRLVEEIDGSPGKQPDIAERASRRGLAVYFWTFDRDEARMARFMEMKGVTGIFTDYPDVAVRLRDR